MKYLRQIKKTLEFLILGRYYYVFHSDRLEYGPRPIEDLGLVPRKNDAKIDKIDAAFMFGPFNKTFIISNKIYWVIDKETGKAELDYPRFPTFFKGVSFPIDSAFRDKDGVLYFFKNRKYHEFNEKKARIAHIRGKLSSERWMNCPRTNEIDSRNENEIDREVVTLRNHRDYSRRYYQPIEHTTFETLVSSKAGISNFASKHLQNSISLGVVVMFLAKYSLQLL